MGRILVFFLLAILDSTKGFNPCEEGNHYVLHKAGWRGTTCARTTSDSICDRYIFSNIWYKAIGHDDLEPRKLAVGPVDMFLCGTDYPLYLLNDTHPTVDGDIETTQVCMRDGSNPCAKQYEIQILSCGSFFLYNLSRPDTCDIAYCFGENMACPKPDPCDSANYEIFPVTEDRSTSCQNKELQLCDSGLEEKWYRPVKQNHDVRMPTTCVPQNRCGTRSPIWLNGNEPTIDDKTTNMKACVNTGITETCSCNKQIDIQIRNCSSFFVYNLTATSSCPERYCFGDTGNCKTMATNGNVQSKSLFEEPTNIVYICLAIGVVLAFLVFLTCMIYKKHLLNVKVESKTEIQHKGEKEEKIPKEEMKNYA
uniref:Uncharacterized protein LOC111107161 n=1 Tax=Crassostrea virginica TaxID=6565 RepID=A0A8B8B4A3_CRAVI|nr:uncharacterized protein LOC111107161 [Crassostrea virginica]